MVDVEEPPLPVEEGARRDDAGERGAREPQPMPFSEGVGVLRSAAHVAERYVQRAAQGEDLVKTLDHHAQLTVRDLDLGHAGIVSHRADP